MKKSDMCDADNNEGRIIIPSYQGNENIVFQIRRLVQNGYADLFRAVIVHGSVGSNDVIDYSDFDGLLVVKDEYMTSQDLKDFEKASLRLIYSFDVTEHHGWFKISSSQLKEYPQSYLPKEALDDSALIYPHSEGLILDYKLEEYTDYISPLKSLIASLEKELKRYKCLENINVYQLKSFLSKVMLIPAMYYAAVNKRGISKKHSFSAGKEYFESEQWHCIVVSSTIRRHWSFKGRFGFEWLMTIPNHYTRSISKRILFPKLKIKEVELLDTRFRASLNGLIKKIRNDLNNASTF